MRHIAFFRGICGKRNRQTDIKCKRQTTPRMDRHETIVTGRCETFLYCHIGGKGMTSAELKHRVKLQEWAARIQDCRSSGLSVRAWCRQEEINATTYYRWERELLALAETEPCSSVSAVRFAEFPAPKRVLHTPLCGIVSTGEIEQRFRLN